jgi:hypothetical protein
MFIPRLGHMRCGPAPRDGYPYGAKNIFVGGWRLATDVLKYQKAHRHSPEKLDEGPGRKRSLFFVMPLFHSTSRLRTPGRAVLRRRPRIR